MNQAGIEKLITGGLINAQSLVWREGMLDWKPAGETELGHLFQRHASTVAMYETSAATPSPANRNNGQSGWERFAAAAGTFIIGAVVVIMVAAVIGFGLVVGFCGTRR